MPNRETKICQICQNCKKDFTIEPEDFLFYEKIKVPPPTFCPDCRMQRRMAWRNERKLYKRKCDRTGKNIISIIAPDKPYIVYDRDVWWSDQWDPLAYGKTYDFSKPFFQQFDELLGQVPLVSVFNSNMVNSEYANHSFDAKNCYLIFASAWNENVLYSNGAIRCKDSMDLLVCQENELCYGNIASQKCFRVFMSHHSSDCRDSFFLYNCKNCINCFGCVNLRSKSYCLFNEQLAKEEYEKRVGEYAGSFHKFEEARKRFQELQLEKPHRFAALIQTVDVVGDNVVSARKCFHCFDIFENTENCKFVSHGGYNFKDSYDGYGLGAGELLYEGIDCGLNASRLLFTLVVYESRDVRYSYNCHNSSNLFGCIGLRSKSYCILNKQYTKEEYEELFPRVIAHMNSLPYTDKKGREYRYGEFFPIELSPFAYNDTIANEHYPLAKERVVGEGYAWREPDPREYAITVEAKDLPDRIEDVSSGITGEVLKCIGCDKGYRIIERELEFLQDQKLPLPRKCPDCRHQDRFKERNPMKLWRRRCHCGGTKSDSGIYQNTAEHFHKNSPCPNEFETSYAPERPEIVYCEQCYQTEVV